MAVCGPAPGLARNFPSLLRRAAAYRNGTTRLSPLTR